MGGNGRTKGRELNQKNTRQGNDVKELACPCKSIDVCNELDVDVLQARNIHHFTAKLDTYRFEDTTT